MRKITLVCSVHRENGLCNARELLRILHAIGPEVIFEEIRPSDFDAYCKRGKATMLEAQAIAMYLESKALQRVPVDQYDMPEDLLAEGRKFQLVSDYAGQTSDEYRCVSEDIDERVHQDGFGYLNSHDYVSAETKLCEIEDSTINESGHQGLIRVLEEWRHLIQARDRGMIRVIRDYCRENVFDTAVFLVGAAHKMGIAREIEKRAIAESDLIEWKLYL